MTNFAVPHEIVPLCDLKIVEYEVRKRIYKQKKKFTLKLLPRSSDSILMIKMTKDTIIKKFSPNIKFTFGNSIW